MNERVSAGAIAPGSQKVSAAVLTPMERDALAAEGRIDAHGFADIAEPERPQAIDLKAEARKKAVKDLKAATEGPAALTGFRSELMPQNSPGEASLRKEMTSLQEKMAAREKCPRCGLHFEEPYEHEATPEDIKAFLKCVLSATPFTREYKLFGGELTVVLGTRSGAVSELIRKVVTLRAKRGEASSEGEIIQALRQLTMVATLKEYNTTERSNRYSELPVDSVESFDKAAQERLSAIPEHVQFILHPLLGKFNMLVDLLTARASDPNFWTGTAK